MINRCDCKHSHLNPPSGCDRFAVGDHDVAVNRRQATIPTVPNITLPPFDWPRKLHAKIPSSAASCRYRKVKAMLLEARGENDAVAQQQNTTWEHGIDSSDPQQRCLTHIRFLFARRGPPLHYSAMFGDPAISRCLSNFVSSDGRSGDYVSS
jgi:hypothetical protein